MGRTQDTTTEPIGGANEATLAAVDARIASYRDTTPLGRAIDAAFRVRTDRRPTRVVLEGGARNRTHPTPRSVVAAATAVDLLGARTAVRWCGLPERAPGSTAAVLVGDYLHSLAFESLVAADADVSAPLVAAVTDAVTALYGVEADAGSDRRAGGVPAAARNGLFTVADAAVKALAAATRVDAGGR